MQTQHSSMAISTYSQKFWVGAICPDQVEFRDIGEADGLRGRVIRLIFWLLQPWAPRGT